MIKKCIGLFLFGVFPQLGHARFILCWNPHGPRLYRTKFLMIKFLYAKVYGITQNKLLLVTTLAFTKKKMVDFFVNLANDINQVLI